MAPGRRPAFRVLGGSFEEIGLAAGAPGAIAAARLCRAVLIRGGIDFQVYQALKLVIEGGFDQTAGMSEIVQFVHHGASRVSPRVLKGIHKKLPLLKAEFATIHAPKYPHLVDQLEFLANVVEDFAEGATEDIPYVALASAAFALIYAHRQFDLIPDSVPEFGHADDSGVVRSVLIEHERVLSDYANKQGIDWSKITVNP